MKLRFSRVFLAWKVDLNFADLADWANIAKFENSNIALPRL